MIIPSKEETVSNNLLVQGAQVLRVLKGGAITIDELRGAYVTKLHPIAPTMERIFDILTYLYIVGFVTVDGAYVALNKTVVSHDT